MEKGHFSTDGTYGTSGEEDLIGTIDAGQINRFSEVILVDDLCQCP